MSTYAVAVAVALLATFTLLDRNRSTCAVTAATVYGGEPTAYSENSAETNYDGDDEGDGEYDGGGRDGTEEREDQLDQDDPVSTVTVTAIRGAVAWLPCDIGGGDNDGLPVQRTHRVGGGDGTRTGKDSAAEDRAYMVLWFKHQQNRPDTGRRKNGKWRRPSSGGKPLYSFDVRGRPLAHALKWSSDADSGGFGTRASFVVFGGSDDGPSDSSDKAALRVTNVSERDAGPYRCRVDFRDSPTRNYRIILRVIVPPDKMTIVYNGATEIGDGTRHYVVGPVAEGSRLVLVCRVLGGNPKPRVQWYSKDGKVSGTIADDGDQNATTEKLVIGKLNRNHANSTYTCVASNDDAVESNLRMTVLVNMYLNVKSVRIVDVRPADDESEEGTVNYSDTGGSNDGQRATNLISGKWYTARCLAEGASPKATVEWSIDGNGTLADEEIPPSPPTSARMTVVEQTERGSRIRLRPTPSDDGRYLRCRAWNPDINTTRDDDNIKNKAILLDVQYPPIVKLSLGRTFDPGRIKTGDDVYFECKILDGGGGGGQRKRRNRVEWYHDGRPILQNGNNNGSANNVNTDVKVVLLSAGTLVIRNVNRRHSGRYTCQCSNDLGTGRSLPVTLRVQYAPVCADDHGDRAQLVGVDRTDDDVRVTCRVYADPSSSSDDDDDDPVQFEWSVWPAVSTAGDIPHQPAPSNSVAVGNYVTTASSAHRRPNGTDTGLVIGELVLPATAAAAVVVGGGNGGAFPAPDTQPQYAVDHAPNVRKKPVALSYAVSCRATNAVGRQQTPCLYHIVPASSPGPLTGCAIRLPKDQERHLVNGNRHHRQQHHHHHNHRRQQLYHRRRRRRRRTSRADGHNGDTDDVTVVSCVLENDGGVRPVAYALEIYESNVLTTGSPGAADKWLADNVTGTAVGDTVEYRVDRKRLRLRIGPDDDRKYLSLSAYAGNRVGRGPRTYFGGETAVLLRHPWWWQREGGPGPAEDGAGTKATTGLAATSSSEWWITLRGDDGHGGHAADDGESTNTVVVVSSAATVTAIVVALVYLWRKRSGGNADGDSGGGNGNDSGGGGGGQLSSITGAAETTIVTNNGRDGKTDGQRSIVYQKQRSRNVYPNLSPADDPRPRRNERGATSTAPDIMIRQNYGKQQCLVSITNCEIPGPESCV